MSSPADPPHRSPRSTPATSDPGYSAAESAPDLAAESVPDMRADPAALSATDLALDLDGVPAGAPQALAGLLPRATWLALDRWLTEPRFRPDRADTIALVARVVTGDEDARAELEDAFSGPLPLGTGGRRGTCGPGPNRMNTTVLRETAQGLANLVHAEGSGRQVVVVYDTRTHSRRFARVVAEQLAAWDLQVLLLDAPRPTPQLAFLVRAQGAAAGVVISASHNPPQDNGIKIYGADGAQVLGARDRALMAQVEGAATAELRQLAPHQAHNIHVVEGAELERMDRAYHGFVAAQHVLASLEAARGLKLVFTPLHGVGHTAVMPVLRARGFAVEVVQAQLPDHGRFATVASANPETPQALELAVAQAQAQGADLALATDPDADRLGACARTAQGTYEFIDGNRLGALMLDHVLRHADLPKDGWVLTTVVTSPLVAKLARAAGVEVIDDLLVGFKHHGGMMAEAPERPVIFACEESHGYVRGNEVHDKDGAVGALLLAECAAEAKGRGETLFDALDRIFVAHGYHRERTASIYAYGVAGREAIARLLAAWRVDPPAEFGGLPLASAVDLLGGRTTGSPTRDLPGDVLVFELGAEGGLACRLAVRPSGTEPKAKVYALGRGPAGAPLSQARQEVDAMVERVIADARAKAEGAMAGAGGV